MQIGRPHFGLPILNDLGFLKKVSLPFKLSLGVVVFIFLSGYQPTFGYPPVRQAVALAQAQQVHTVDSKALPFEFQLPHPGYISTHFSSYHPAIDIAAGLGMPIHPIAKGTVVEIGFNIWGLGLTVTVDHGQGYRSLYAHLGKIYVKSGQEVGLNDVLGEVGLTGHTSGPHTHLELYKDGTNIDPTPFLPTLPELAAAWSNK